MKTLTSDNVKRLTLYIDRYKRNFSDIIVSLYFFMNFTFRRRRISKSLPRPFPTRSTRSEKRPKRICPESTFTLERDHPVRRIRIRPSIRQRNGIGCPQCHHRCQINFPSASWTKDGPTQGTGCPNYRWLALFRLENLRVMN